MSGALTRDDILHADDLPVEKVDVPEWGGHVYVRGLTGAERDAYESEIVRARDGGDGDDDVEVNLENIRARLLVRCLVDEAGERLFTEADVEALGAKSGSAVQRCWERARQLSGITRRDVDELEKNSGGGRNDAPGSDLP